jgi:hypothetical protein
MTYYNLLTIIVPYESLTHERERERERDTTCGAKSSNV